MAKYFYFSQTVSKKPNLDDLAFKKPTGNPGLRFGVMYANKFLRESGTRAHIYLLVTHLNIK